MTHREDAIASPDGDLFELLFPREEPAREGARRWTQLLTLVLDDARRHSRPLADEELRVAERVFERTDAEHVLDALDDLLPALFDELLDGDSFFALVRARRDWNAALDALELAAPRWARPDRAGETPAERAVRYVAGYGELTLRLGGVRAARYRRRAESWRLCAIRVTQGVEGVERALDECARGSVPERIARVEARVAVALECGAVNRAGDVLDEARSLVALDRGLGRWRRLVDALKAPAGTEPPEWPDLVPTGLTGLVQGGAPNPRREGGSRGPGPSRRAVGAVCVVLFQLGPDGRLEVRDCDLAPGLSHRLTDFALERDLAWREPDSLERRAVEQREVVVRRDGSVRSKRVSTRSRAEVVVPLEDPTNAGWLYLEFEHALVPGARRLTELARKFEARSDADETKEEPASAAAHAEARWDFAREVGGAWFDWRAGSAEPMGRVALAWDLECASLERAARLGLVDEGRGVIAPVTLEGRTIGLVCGERAPELAADPTLVARWQDARFADWYAEHYGKVVEPRAALGGRADETFLRFARARADLELVGTPGSGRRTAARRLFFESGSGGRLLEHFDESAFDARIHSDAERPVGRDDWVLVHDPERFGPRAQNRLAVAFPGVRLLVTSSRPLASLVAEGSVVPALAARLARLSLVLRPLGERRGELPGLAQHFFAAIARREGWQAPELTDEAQAFLWRQSYPGGVGELEALVYAASFEGAVTLESLERSILERGGDPVSRIAGDDELSFEAAIDETRLANGRVNKRRAAAYLGWDRDTVRAHLKRRAVIDADDTEPDL